MAARGRERMAKPAVPRARPTHAHSVAAGHRCQLSPALSHILVLCLLFSDKEDIQPVNSHKTRLEAGRRQSVAATSVGSRPCSLASSSQAQPHPFPRTPLARTPPPWPWDGTWPPHATRASLVLGTWSGATSPRGQAAAPRPLSLSSPLFWPHLGTLVRVCPCSHVPALLQQCLGCKEAATHLEHAGFLLVFILTDA